MQTDPPSPDLRSRVRWGNVARALALLAVAALVVAWPRLRTEAPEVPAGAAVPVRQAPVQAPTTPPVVTRTQAVRPAPRSAARPRARARKPRRGRARRRHATTPTTTRLPDPTPAPATAPSRPPPAEFGVE